MSDLFEKTITLRKKFNSVEAKKLAMRSGNYVVKEKKNSEASEKYKLDNETEELKHNRIDKNISKLIRDARNAKGYNQKTLANMINVQVKTINDYESGKAIPQNNILGILERKLKVKLRGKK